MALEYPKMLYHDFFGQRVVQTQDEEMELMNKKEGWRATPSLPPAAAPAPREETHRGAPSGATRR